MRNNRGQNIDFISNSCYNMDMEKVRLLSVEQTAGILGVSRSTAYNYLNSGQLKAIKLNTRTMIRLADLEKFIESRKKYEGCINEV